MSSFIVDVPFQNSLQPLFQSESTCVVFVKVLPWWKIELYCFFFDITKVLMLGPYQAKFQVFMSKGSAINWAAISDFDWPPLQIQIWPGITERTGTWRGVTSSNHDRKNNVATLVAKLNSKLKLKLKLCSEAHASGGWLDDVTGNTAVVKYSGLQVYERSNGGRVFTIFGGLYQGRKN